jgi:hypothetical protein
MSSGRLFWGGLAFFGVGSTWAVLAASYPIGTASRMGPGYFPLVLAVLLGAIGLIAIAQAALTPSDARIEVRPLWPCVVVSAAVVAFGLLLNTAGLVPAVLGLVVIGGGHRLRSRPVELLVIAAILAIGAAALFIRGLQLPLDAFRFGEQ